MSEIKYLSTLAINQGNITPIATQYFYTTPEVAQKVMADYYAELNKDKKLVITHSTGITVLAMDGITSITEERANKAGFRRDWTDKEVEEFFAFLMKENEPCAGETEKKKNPLENRFW